MWRLGLLLLTLLGLGACQPVQPVATADIPEFTVAVSDDGVTVPEIVPGGIVRVTMKNSSSQPPDVAAMIAGGATAAHTEHGMMKMVTVVE
ncbi:MAG: hypothetical protein WAU00_15015 [Caldilinea sp.]|uniref:hypothetical protein n=1 Tax=Caldilinea sp. TaxID=2293560 RepID=UPI002C84345C|nr:hypothetical protein [Anaerolineales bacterium]HQY92608.1 hypothetical protein [Caldilinea sp.]